PEATTAPRTAIPSPSQALRDTARRSESEGRYGRNRPSRRMLGGQVFGRGTCNAIPPEHWIAGRHSAVRARCPSILVLGFAALNPFYGGSMTHEPRNGWGSGTPS